MKVTNLETRLLNVELPLEFEGGELLDEQHSVARRAVRAVIQLTPGT